METSCLLIRVRSGLIAIQNELRLLFALEILKDSMPVSNFWIKKLKTLQRNGLDAKC